MEYVNVPRGRLFLLSERIVQPDFSAVDLTGFTSTLHVCEAYGATPVLSLTETAGISLGTDGMAIASIDPSDLPNDSYVFQWIVLDTSGLEAASRNGVFFMESEL